MRMLRDSKRALEAENGLTLNCSRTCVGGRPVHAPASPTIFDRDLSFVSLSYDLVWKVRARLARGFLSITHRLNLQVGDFARSGKKGRVGGTWRDEMT